MNNTTLIGSDIHFGEHSPAYVNTFLAIVAKTQPQIIILAGDILDCSELHKSVRGTRQTPRQGRSSLQVGEEIILAKLFLKAIRDITIKAKVVFLEGNHEARYPRTLANSCPEAYPTVPLLEDVLGLQGLNIDWLPGNAIFTGVPGWRISHGTRCSMNAARLDGRTGQGSWAQGHTHRLSAIGETDPSSGKIRWYCETGHLMSLRKLISG